MAESCVEDLEILCLQEPHVFRGKLGEFRGKFDCFYKKEAQVRAAIIIPKNNIFKGWLMPEITDGDVVSVMLHSKDNDINNLIVISAYFDITSNEVIPEKLIKAIEMASAGKNKVIVCADSNAHSRLWGPDQNARGCKLEEFIFSHNLNIENRGEVATFIGRGTSTVIDVTLTLNFEKIQDWKVMEDHNSNSDHRMITFEVRTEKMEKQNDKPVIERICWKKFTSHIDNMIRDDKRRLTWIDEEWIETEAKFITDRINKAISMSSFRKSNKCTKRSKPPYWSQEVAVLRKDMDRMHRRWRANETQVNWLAYKEAKKTFRKEVAKAKTKSWRELVENVEAPKEMAKLARALQSNEIIQNQIASTQRELGSPEQTASAIIDKLFPGSSERTDERRKRDKHNAVRVEEVDSNSESEFITAERVKHFISTFESGKAAGDDRIKPIILKNLPPTTIDRLVRLYKASLKLKYIPENWCNSRVVIIPKRGKEDYSNPKSFRPISLTSFLFKTLEKIVKDEIEGKYLKKSPLNKHQHAFRAGHSCESALFETVDFIESASMRNEFCLGVFLDISGAFDNLKLDAAERGMKAKRISQSITDWYKFYLENRTICTEIGGVEIRRCLNQGTPQGGVLSPLIWNLAMESLLEALNNGPVRAVGFADDACILIRGKDTNCLIDRANDAVKVAEKWGFKSGLAFNEAKTKVVLFSQKRKIPETRNITINGKEVGLDSEVKYLGITLDRKLNFKQHIEEKIAKGKRFLYNVKKATSKIWGLKPKMMLWAYKAMVRPMISYGAIVWGHKVASFSDKLNRLQRLAMLSAAWVFRSTPTAGLEVIMGLEPLELYIKGTQEAAFIRNRKLGPLWDGIGANKNRGIRFVANKTLEELNLENTVLDKNEEGPNLNRKFEIKMVPMVSTGEDDLNCAISLTKMENSRSWLAKITNSSKSWVNIFYGVLEDSEDEILGYSSGLVRVIKEIENRQECLVNILIDSVGMVQALRAKKSSRRCIKDCWNKLQELMDSKRVRICFCNKKFKETNPFFNLFRVQNVVEVTAKRGKTLVNPATIKEMLTKRFMECWNKKWTGALGCRQTKQFWPGVNPDASIWVQSLDRITLSKMIQLITGHGFNRHHLRVLGLSEDEQCRYCLEDDESTWHVVAECPALSDIRVRAFQFRYLAINDFKPDYIYRFPTFVSHVEDLFSLNTGEYKNVQG